MGMGWHLGQHQRRRNNGLSSTDLARARRAAHQAAFPQDPDKPSILSLVQAEEDALPGVPRLFTFSELQQAKHDYLASSSPSSSSQPPIYLAIVGHVFDVSKGDQFYAPPDEKEGGREGGGYGFFAFRDAARAYVTGDFSKEGLREDVEGLKEEECRGVWRWVNFFKDKEEYPFVGRLVGMYFDADGRPTRSYLNFRACVGTGEGGKGVGGEEGEEEACATSWERGKGHTVWCEGSDGKVPRRRLKEGGGEARGRCVCVDLKDGKVHAAEAEGTLVVYPGCEPQQSMCAFE